ncbi:MAG: hypothetical protein EHM19_07155 [Candidatus Latescibacterota bacterium]|nr:MAG: hypothetical protein EHM19_07155 [Candidatus Latescibacterota bacterium]
MLAAPAASGEIPESALSHSLRIRPEFLDGEGLLFAFPQRASSVDAQVLSLSGSGALGMIGRTESAGFFVLAQGTPSHLPGASTLYQAGWGIGLSSFSFGAAVRASYKSEQGQSGRLRIHDPEEYDFDGSTNLDRSIQGAFGLGVHRGSFRADLAVDWERSSQEGGRVDRIGSYYDGYDTLWSQAESRNDGAWGASARVAFPLGEKVTAVAVGSWIRPDQDWTSAALADTFFLRRDEKLKIELWRAGVAFAFPGGMLDRIIVSSMVRVREGLDIVPRYDGFMRETAYRNYWISGSVEHAIRPPWVVRAGVEGRYEKSTFYETRLAIPDQIYYERSGEESMGADFSWGTSYRWRNIRLDGSVSKTLDIDYLLVGLDAHVLF